MNTSEAIQRLVRIEEGHRNITVRLDHLDECLDETKARIRTWDKRWWISLGMIIGMVFTSGSGTISLQSLIAFLKHFSG